MTLVEVFDREERSMLDIRVLVRAEMIRQHGGEDGALAALARRMAPRWGILFTSAECKLSRWLGRAKGWDMKTDALEALLDELGCKRIPFEEHAP